MVTKTKLSTLLTFLLIIFVTVYIFLDDKGGNFKNPVQTKYPGIFQPIPSYFRKVTHTGEVIDSSHPNYRIIVRTDRPPQDVTHSSLVELQVVPGLIDNAQYVTLKWRSDLLSDNHYYVSDWIALYCPFDSQINEYIDYILVKDYPQSSAQLQLYNLRTDCQFRYYSNYTGNVRLLAKSNVVHFKGGHAAPFHGHLALTGNPSEMRVQWTSGTKEASIVLYGTDPTRLVWRSIGEWTTYKAADMCGEPARSDANFIDPGYFHDVLLTGLVPSTVYYYQYGSVHAMSDIHSFRASPSIGDLRSFKFLTYGDMGIDTGSGVPGAQTTADLATRDIDNGIEFIVHQGDLSYAVGYSYIWELWMHLIEPMATRVPYMIGIGNHEQNFISNNSKVRDPSGVRGDGYHPPWGNYGHDSGGECGVPVTHRFHMPDNGNKVWWYSFKYGVAHFVVMSTEHDFNPGSKQYKWLESDMGSVDRSITPWLILLGHRPMYNSEMYPEDHKVALHIQKGLEDLLYKYGVDLALWGHYHSYERTCRVYNNKCNPKGTMHVVIGSAGVDTDSTSQYDVEWSEHLEMNYGYGRVTVSNKSALLWEFVRNVDATVADSVWMHK